MMAALELQLKLLDPAQAEPHPVVREGRQQRRKRRKVTANPTGGYEPWAFVT